MKESTLHQTCLRKLRTWPNCHVIKVHGSPYLAGQPDLIGCLEGRFFAIELKVGTNHPTKLQLVNLKKWREAGAITGVAWSWNDVVALLGHR